MREPNGAIVYLIGFAGTGKLTIARALLERFDAILVDNHHINNVIFALLDKDGRELPEEVWGLVGRVRAAAMDAIRTLARPGRNFIFTNELIEGVEQHHDYFQEVAAVAAFRGALLLPVRLAVDPDELARRVTQPERAEKLKDMDADRALAKAGEKEVLNSGGYEFFELDVTSLEPDDAARRIVAELEARRTAWREGTQ